MSDSVSILWYWFAFLFYLLSSDLVIQLLEESNKFLELLRDVVKYGKYIFDCIVQYPHKSNKFCRVIIL
jgi:hypothetical protein